MQCFFLKIFIISVRIISSKVGNITIIIYYGVPNAFACSLSFHLYYKVKSCTIILIFIQVINQQGKAVLVFNQDQQQQLSGQQPQQIVKQVINTPSGQQIVRQVVVPSGTVLPSGQQMTSLDGTTPNHNSIVTTNGLTDNKARQTPPLTNGDHLSPSASPAPPSVSQSPPPNSSTAAQQQPPVKIDPSKPFLCEWAGCMKAFKAPKEVERHAIAEHCPIHLEGEDIPCLWARCDGLKRKRFSLMTHFQDRHCHPQVRRIDR